MVTKSETKKIRLSGKLSIKDGFFTGMMNGFGDRYIPAFALFLGSSNFLIALITTVPGLLGNFAQLFSVNLIKKGSRKRVVVINAAVQAFLWLPIIFVGLLYYYYESMRFISPILLLVIYSCLIIVGSVAGPIWNSWMRDLVSVNKGKYFGVRNQIVNIAIILSMLFSGVILNFFSASEAIFGFLIIFVLATISRFVSVIYLARQYEPRFVYSEDSYFGFVAFVSKMLRNNFGRFVLFVSLISFATAIAGPFFVVYELEELGLNYLSFTIVSLAAIVTTIIFLPIWGKFSDKYGNVWVLRFTSMIIPLIPILWIVTYFFRSNLLLTTVYLISIEFISGLIWGGFNLSASNFIFDAVSRERMAICVAYFNFINALLTFLGAMFGTLLSKLHLSLGFIDGFLFIFLFSGLMRLIVVIIMNHKIHEVREVRDFHLRAHIKKQLLKGKVILWRYIGLEPIRLVN